MAAFFFFTFCLASYSIRLVGGHGQGERGEGARGRDGDGGDGGRGGWGTDAVTLNGSRDGNRAGDVTRKRREGGGRVLGGIGVVAGEGGRDRFAS